MRLLKRSDSSASTAQAPKHKRSISRFFSNLSLSSKASRPDRPASVLGFGTYPAARQSEQIDRGVKGEHGLLGRASFDAISSRFARARNVSFSHTSVLDDSTLGPVLEVARETSVTPAKSEAPATPRPMQSPPQTYSLQHANTHIESPRFDSPYSLMHISAESTPITQRRSSAPSPDSRPPRRSSESPSRRPSVRFSPSRLSAKSLDDVRDSPIGSSTVSGSQMSRDTSSGCLSVQSVVSTGASSGSKTSRFLSHFKRSPSTSLSPPLPQPIPILHKPSIIPPSTSTHVIPSWLLEDSFEHLFRNSPPSSRSSSPVRANRIPYLDQPANYSQTSVNQTPCPLPSSPEDNVNVEIITAQRKKLVKRKAVPVGDTKLIRTPKSSKDSFADSIDVQTPETPDVSMLQHQQSIRRKAVPLESNVLDDNHNVRLPSKFQAPADPSFESETPDYASVFDLNHSQADDSLDYDEAEQDEWDGTYQADDIDFEARSDSEPESDGETMARSDTFGYDSPASSSFGSNGTVVIHSTPYRNARQSIGGAIDRLLEDVEDWTMGTAIRVSPLRIKARVQDETTTRTTATGRVEELRQSWEQRLSETPSPRSSDLRIREILNRKSSISSAELTLEAKALMEKTREERRARLNR